LTRTIVDIILADTIFSVFDIVEKHRIASSALQTL